MWTDKDMFLIPNESGIGDVLQYTPLPEYYFGEFNKKMILFYDDRYGFYKDNPYVDLRSHSQLPQNKHDRVIDLWNNKLPEKKGSPCYRHLSRYTNVKGVDRDLKPIIYGLTPALIDPRKVVIFTTGKNRTQKGWTGYIPRAISEYISFNLERFGYNVIHMDFDEPLLPGAIDKRRLPLSDVITEIQSCSILISPNTGPMHIAAAVNPSSIWSFTLQPIANPVYDSDLEKYTAHDWLYQSSNYFGPPNKENVTPIEEFLEWAKNRLSCI